MNFLKKLFGASDGDAVPAASAEEYQGYRITPAPIAEGGEYRIAATIEKDGRSHRLVRADTMRDRDAAIEASVAKARQVIDEQGERIFG